MIPDEKPDLQNDASANAVATEAQVKEEGNAGATQKKNSFVELTEAMKSKRQVLLSKIGQIKELRKKLESLNKVSLRVLQKKKERLEFKIATEAITLEKERELMKSLKGLEAEIRLAEQREAERKKLLGEIKVLDGEIESLKNELDEMKLNLIKLREERKKRRAEARKKREMKEAKQRQPQIKKEELVVNLEDIAIIKKEKQ